MAADTREAGLLRHAQLAGWPVRPERKLAERVLKHLRSGTDRGQITVWLSPSRANLLRKGVIFCAMAANAAVHLAAGQPGSIFGHVYQTATQSSKFEKVRWPSMIY